MRAPLYVRPTLRPIRCILTRTFDSRSSNLLPIGLDLVAVVQQITSRVLGLLRLQPRRLILRRQDLHQRPLLSEQRHTEALAYVLVELLR